MDARIVGWGHTPFGILKHMSFEQLVRAAAQEAMDHAGIGPEDIDAVWLGHFNAGMVPDAFASSIVLGMDEGFRFKPATRVENACASGSAAVYAARDAIRGGAAQTVLVIGAEKMTTLNTAGVTKSLAQASYQAEEGDLSFPQIFGRFAAAYFQQHGDHSVDLAKIAAKNHKNAVGNPLAQLRKDLGFKFCNTVSEKNPLIAPPLRLTDCSLISDGAAALIMVADDRASTFPQSVKFRAAVQVNDYLPMSMRGFDELTGARRAFDLAYEASGTDVNALDVAEVHDCFTIAELMIYEAMGLAPVGKGADAIRDGRVMTDGALPINLSGGLKAKGHPVGATGVSMHVQIARQVTGTANAMQAKGAELGCVFNMGGSSVANYCSILEAAR